MNVAIVDDLSSDRQYLLENIEKYCTNNRVHLQVTCYEDGLQFIEALKEQRFDLAFLDVYMEASNGIEVAKHLRDADADCQIIFTTTSREDAVAAFDLHVLDYLLKPYSYERLEEALQLYERTAKKHARFVELKEGRYFKRVLISDIIYTDYHNHYIYVHTKNNVVRSYMPFQEFAPMLADFPQFLCCYRNCLVNMDYVKLMENDDFLLTTGERIPISRTRRQEIRQEYANYIFDFVTKGEA